MRNFLQDKDIVKWEDQKPWPGLARNHDFAEGGGIEVNLKSENV